MRHRSRLRQFPLSPFRPQPGPRQRQRPTAVALPTLTPTPILLGDYPLLSPADMRFDLDELFHRLETTHPNPYATRPKAEVDRERQRLSEALARPMTMLDFYKAVAPLVNSLGDRHTYIALSPETNRLIAENERFFPFQLQWEAGRAYVITNLSGNPDIPFGAELLAINGSPVTAVQEQTSGYAASERYLSLPEIWLLLGSVADYQLTLLLPGENTPVVVTAVGLTSAELVTQTADGPAPELVTYTTLPDEAIGVLTINGFQGLGPSLKSAFAQIQADGVTHLVLDLRANGGGLYEQVTSVLDYLLDEPFRWCSRQYVAPFGGYGSGSPRETDCEWLRPFDVAERYQGQLYVLIGPDTFSGAITLATALQDSGRAQLIGEETLDTASYCANVPTEMLPLPRTGLLYQSSQTCLVRPSGRLNDEGVMPDIIVPTTLADQVAGRDPVLAHTLDMIRRLTTITPTEMSGPQQ
jgi:hypothetical protein